MSTRTQDEFSQNHNGFAPHHVCQGRCHLRSIRMLKIIVMAATTFTNTAGHVEYAGVA